MTTDEKLDAIETAIQLLTAQIINLRTELLAVKAQVNIIATNTNTDLEEEEPPDLVTEIMRRVEAPGEPDDEEISRRKEEEFLRKAEYPPGEV